MTRRKKENAKLKARRRAANERSKRRSKQPPECHCQCHRYYDPDTDDTYAYIAGYTSGGLPYGVTWEEFDEVARLYHRHHYYRQLRYEEQRMGIVVSLQSVIDAMDIVNQEKMAYLHQNTGELVVLGDKEMRAAEQQTDLDDLPSWQRQPIQRACEVIDNGDEYLALPGHYDVDEHAIMQQFCTTTATPSVRDALSIAIRGPGARRRFNDTIERLGISEVWYRYRALALEEIAVEWLEARRIAYRATGGQDPSTEPEPRTEHR
jgi:hypothetical protein